MGKPTRMQRTSKPRKTGRVTMYEPLSGDVAILRKSNTFIYEVSINLLSFPLEEFVGKIVSTRFLQLHVYNFMVRFPESFKFAKF